MAVAVRVVLSGVFTAGLWGAEEAQMGWSLRAGEAPVAGVAIDSDLPTFIALPSGGSGSWAGGTYSLGWTGDLGVTEQEVLAVAALTFAGDVDQWQSDDFAWNEIRISAFNPDGSVVNGASVFTIGTPVAGDATTMNLPPQNAIVSSFITGGRGARNRGRNYMPLHTATALADGAVFGSSNRTTLLTAQANCMGAMGAGGVVYPAVISMAHGTYSDIVTLRVGDLVDTQRRRRESGVETFSTLAFP